MIWCRFQIDGKTSFGIVEGNNVTEVWGNPLEDYAVTNHSYALDQVKLLAPIRPPMLYAAGPNYRGHVEGMAARRGSPPAYPDRPSPNYRSVHAVIATEENIVVPGESSGAVQPEGQLAVVIGKKARNVPVSEALDYVFGYTIGNDISQRPWQQADRTMFRGKNCDTWKPMGPWIVTDLDPKGSASSCATTVRCGRTFRRPTRSGTPPPGFTNSAPMPLCTLATSCGWGPREPTGTCSPETPSRWRSAVSARSGTTWWRRSRPTAVLRPHPVTQPFFRSNVNASLSRSSRRP